MLHRKIVKVVSEHLGGLSLFYKIMTELIKLTELEGKKAVSARELYNFLEATERFSNWIERQFQYGFSENVDYVGCKVFNTLANQEIIDYALTIDCAKEISMLQRSEQGKIARQYFIECEKQLSLTQYKLPQTYSEALRELADTNDKLIEAEEEIKVLAPKAEYCEKVLDSEGSFNITVIAKELDMSAEQLNNILRAYKIQYKPGKSWVLYAQYTGLGYTINETYVDHNNISHINMKWTQKGRRFIHDTIGYKRQNFFNDKIL